MLLPDLFHDDFGQRPYHDWHEVLVNLLKKTATRKQKIVKSNKNKDGA